VSRHIPYGFELAVDEKTLLPNLAEQQVMTQIRALRVEGLSLRQIASLLTQSNIRTKRGGSWTAKVIQTLLHREVA
jgi:hypothetical protein